MSFLCQATPEYGWEKKIQELGPPAWFTWRSGAHSIRDTFTPETTQANYKCPWEKGRDLLMDAEELDVWNKAGIEMHVSRCKGMASNARELQNTIFQVHVANVGLLEIKMVEVLENTCTYELQKWLDRGWKLLAVCPPNDARRPTYIVGHHSKEGHD